MLKSVCGTSAPAILASTTAANRSSARSKPIPSKTRIKRLDLLPSCPLSACCKIWHVLKA